MAWVTGGGGRCGVDVERTGLRHLAAAIGATTRLHYLPVEPETQWLRLSARDDVSSFRIERLDMDRYATMFEEPSAEELAGVDDRPDDPPPRKQTAPPDPKGTQRRFDAGQWR